MGTTDWKTVSYTVRRPGNAAWETGLQTLAAAKRSLLEANRDVEPGHAIYAEQECGELRRAVPVRPLDDDNGGQADE